MVFTLELGGNHTIHPEILFDCDMTDMTVVTYFLHTERVALVCEPIQR